MLFLQDLNDNEGSFISLEHWYEPGTNCSYLLQGSTSQLVRLHFEKMKISKKTEIKPDDGHCGEYLILYDDDWANPQRIIKAMLHQNINNFLMMSPQGWNRLYNSWIQILRDCFSLKVLTISLKKFNIHVLFFTSTEWLSNENFFNQ